MPPRVTSHARRNLGFQSDLWGASGGSDNWSLANGQFDSVNMTVGNGDLNANEAPWKQSKAEWTSVSNDYVG